MEITEYPPGTFCYPELATTDSEGAKRFYTQLFGWEAVDSPVGPGMVYTMLRLRGKSVGALYGMGEERRAAGPPAWLSYVTVANVDASAKKAAALGGTVRQEPFDVMEVGRMALLDDPTGARFALWQPRQHIGAELVNEPGALCWNELATRDPQQAGAFYTGLFGWGKQVQDMGLGEYTTFQNGDRPAAGMYAIRPEHGDMPPNWMVYFAVADCDASAAQAGALGAKVAMPPQDIPGIGRFATLVDPQGAMFSIIKLSGDM
jgi:uncharacterized protein